MNRRYLSTSVILVTCTLTASVAAGQTRSSPSSTNEVPSHESPSLSIEPGISEQIYRQSTMSTSSAGVVAVTVDSAVRVFIPSQLTLANDYFRVAFADQVGSVPGFLVGPELPLLGTPETAKLNSFFKIGYAYLQGIYEATTDSDLEVRDAIELQWIPLQAGLAAQTRAWTSQRLRFGFVASGGVDWITRSGELDGMNQTFWIPRYEVGPEILLFSQQTPQRGGFDGIRISVVSYHSFSTDQASQGVAADLGARYAF